LFIITHWLRRALEWDSPPRCDDNKAEAAQHLRPMTVRNFKGNDVSDNAATTNRCFKMLLETDDYQAFESCSVT